MEITLLTEGMLGFRLREEADIEPDWFTPHIRDFIQYDRNGCFALGDDTGPIGMVTTTCYQSTGWIGWLYVAEEHRNKGYGEQLMRHAVGYAIGRRMRAIVLEAVPEAVSLYKRIGFSEQFFTQHYLLTPESFRPTGAGDIAVRPLQPAELSRLGGFDARFFHQDRGPLFAIAAANPNFSGLVAESGGEIAGFLFWEEAASTRQAGPLVVRTENAVPAAIASALVAAAFEGNDKPLHLRCPQVHPERARPLLDIGAVAKKYHTVRMFLGDTYRLESPGTLSLGCPGRG